MSPPTQTPGPAASTSQRRIEHRLLTDSQRRTNAAKGLSDEAFLKFRTRPTKSRPTKPKETISKSLQAKLESLGMPLERFRELEALGRSPSQDEIRAVVRQTK